MSINFRIASLLRAGVISVAVVVPAISGLATPAHADDEYGTNRGPSILSSAQSVRFANPADTPLARATAQAHAATSAIASTARVAPVAGPGDLVGQNGPQDQTAREIYHPGSGTDW